MRSFILITLCLSLTACNSVYLKPNTLNTNEMLYAARGGYSMQRSIKQTMEERGYTVHVGTLKNDLTFDDGSMQTVSVPSKAKYVVYVKERKEFLRPIWCMFNGFWWWNFSVSITDRANGEEILSWRGRGCANSSLRKLNDILDELEMKEPVLYQKKDIQIKQDPNTQELLITVQHQ